MFVFERPISLRNAVFANRRANAQVVHWLREGSTR